jgi:hypothetical protein
VDHGTKTQFARSVTQDLGLMKMPLMGSMDKLTNNVNPVKITVLSVIVL